MMNLKQFFHYFDVKNQVAYIVLLPTLDYKVIDTIKLVFQLVYDTLLYPTIPLSNDQVMQTY